MIIVVFMNLNYSRIGRGWVAIREDELAAEAMGVNAFGLKLLAFARGRPSLAGDRGFGEGAALDTSVVTPDQYTPSSQSAFLLAAVVLGGMGTVTGSTDRCNDPQAATRKLRFFSTTTACWYSVC